jgi:hypothetical protein
MTTGRHEQDEEILQIGRYHPIRFNDTAKSIINIINIFIANVKNYPKSIREWQGRGDEVIIIAKIIMISYIVLIVHHAKIQ